MASPKRKTSHEEMYTPPVERTEADVIAMPFAEPHNNEWSSRQQPSFRIGEILKRERERRGYDLQQIADYLCIRRGLLAAIENSNYQEFPADAYVIGFLRSYAELIGLDGQEAIEHYRQEMAGRRRKPDLIIRTPISQGRAPTAAIMGAAAAASLLIYVAWYAFSGSDRASVTTPPVPVPVATSAEAQASTNTPANETLAAAVPSGIAISAPAPVQKTLSPAAAITSTPSETAATSVKAPSEKVAAEKPKPAAAPVETSDDASAAPLPSAHIVIKATQSSWVLISNSDGQTVYDRVMKAGEVYAVPNTPGLSLTTGNGAGVVIIMDGAELPHLSMTTSRIVRNVPLETASLRALREPAY